MNSQLNSFPKNKIEFNFTTPKDNISSCEDFDHQIEVDEKYESVKFFQIFLSFSKILIFEKKKKSKNLKNNNSEIITFPKEEIA